METGMMWQIGPLKMVFPSYRLKTSGINCWKLHLNFLLNSKASKVENSIGSSRSSVTKTSRENQGRFWRIPFLIIFLNNFISFSWNFSSGLRGWGYRFYADTFFPEFADNDVINSIEQFLLLGWPVYALVVAILEGAWEQEKFKLFF